jgi:hypothetical protein
MQLEAASQWILALTRFAIAVTCAALSQATRQKIYEF